MAAHIVAGIDCSPVSADVLRWAERQASLNGYDLHVVAAFGAGLPDAAPGRGTDAASAMRTAVGKVVASALGQRPDVVVRVCAEHPEDALLAESAGAELVAIGKRRRRPGLPLGSTSAKVASQATCPVAVIPPAALRPAPEVGHIVVGVDASPLSTTALCWAADQAERTGALVTVLMAWEWAPTYEPNSYDVPPQEIRWQCEQALNAQLAAVPKGVTIRTDIRQGRPVDLLLSSSRDAAVLVVGSSGLGAARSFLLGSVSRQLVHHAKVPLVVTHGHDHAPAARERVSAQARQGAAQ